MATECTSSPTTLMSRTRNMSDRSATHMLAHAHIHKCSSTHTYTYTHANTHTHTHTHTHTLAHSMVHVT